MTVAATARHLSPDGILDAQRTAAVQAEPREHCVDEAVPGQAGITPAAEACDQGAAGEPQPEVDASQFAACKEFGAVVRTAPDRSRSGARGGATQSP